MAPNDLKTSLLEKANEAYWDFPDDTLSSHRRIANAIKCILDSGLCDYLYLRTLVNTVLMPDIAMCNGDDCPVKKMCWRHVAPESHFQSYFSTPPHDDEGCEYFWDINEK